MLYFFFNQRYNRDFLTKEVGKKYMSGSSKKAVLTAFAANTGIAITKTAGAVVTGSGTLFAEALHSFADCTNQILLLIGMSQANRKPDYLF